jgi:hypothetical protein
MILPQLTSQDRVMPLFRVNSFPVSCKSLTGGYQTLALDSAIRGHFIKGCHVAVFAAAAVVAQHSLVVQKYFQLKIKALAMP